MINKDRSIFFLGLAASAGLFASCGEGASDKKLDAIIARLDSLEKKVDNIPGRLAGAAAQPRPPQRPQLDPGTVYAVSVADSDPYVGAKHAKVTIVEAYDYACPYCKMTVDVLEKIVEARGADVRVVGKQFVVHPQVATDAALAACASAKQAKFGKFSSELWKSAWSAEGRLDASKLAYDSIEQIAGKLGLNVQKLKADMKGCAQDVERDQRELAMLGVNGTPTFFINGRPYAGPRTVEGFNAVIDEELKKANDAIKSGMKVEDYYPSLVKNAKKTL